MTKENHNANAALPAAFGVSMARDYHSCLRTLGLLTKIPRPKAGGRIVRFRYVRELAGVLRGPLPEEDCPLGSHNVTM